MSKYPTYRNAETPWLDSIPSYWRELSNFAIFHERNDRGHVNEELLSVTQNQGIIKQENLELKKDSSNEDKSNYKLVKPGDIVYNKMRMWQGAVGASEYQGIVSPAYIVLTPKIQINSKFFHYLFRTPNYSNEAYRHSYGIHEDQLSLRYGDFKRMLSIFPPVEEQNAIVKFLERKLADIDRFITNKQRLIELLNEKKAAIINRAVIRGLDPDVEMKPAGMTAINRIPSHWGIKKLKFCIDIKNGQVDPRLDEYKDMTLIGPNHIEPGTGMLLSKETAKEQAAESGKYLFERNDVIYSKIRPELRKAYLAKSPGLCSADMYPLKSRSDVWPEYLLYTLVTRRSLKLSNK